MKNNNIEVIPVALFAYARPNHIRITLEALEKAEDGKGIGEIRADTEGDPHGSRALAVDALPEFLE